MRPNPAGRVAVMGKHGAARAQADDLDFFPTPEWCVTALGEFVEFAE